MTRVELTIVTLLFTAISCGFLIPRAPRPAEHQQPGIEKTVPGTVELERGRKWLLRLTANPVVVAIDIRETTYVKFSITPGTVNEPYTAILRDENDQVSGFESREMRLLLFPGQYEMSVQSHINTDEVVGEYELRMETLSTTRDDITIGGRVAGKVTAHACALHPAQIHGKGLIEIRLDTPEKKDIGLSILDMKGKLRGHAGPSPNGDGISLYYDIPRGDDYYILFSNETELEAEYSLSVRRK
jgi:hypothetical protein